MQRITRTILWAVTLGALNLLVQVQDSASSPQELAADQTFAPESGVPVLTVDEAIALSASVAKIGDSPASLLRMGSAYISFEVKNPAFSRWMFSAAVSGSGWRLAEVLAAGAPKRAVLENLLWRGSRVGVSAPALSRKSRATNLRVCTCGPWFTASPCLQSTAS